MNYYSQKGMSIYIVQGFAVVVKWQVEKLRLRRVIHVIHILFHMGKIASALRKTADFDKIVHIPETGYAWKSLPSGSLYSVKAEDRIRLFSALIFDTIRQIRNLSVLPTNGILQIVIKRKSVPRPTWSHTHSDRARRPRRFGMRSIPRSRSWPRCRRRATWAGCTPPTRAVSRRPAPRHG